MRLFRGHLNVPIGLTSVCALLCREAQRGVRLRIVQDAPS